MVAKLWRGMNQWIRFRMSVLPSFGHQLECFGRMKTKTKAKTTTRSSNIVYIFLRIYFISLTLHFFTYNSFMIFLYPYVSSLWSSYDEIIKGFFTVVRSAHWADSVPRAYTSVQEIKPKFCHIMTSLERKGWCPKTFKVKLLKMYIFYLVGISIKLCINDILIFLCFCFLNKFKRGPLDNGFLFPRLSSFVCFVIFNRVYFILLSLNRVLEITDACYRIHLPTTTRTIAVLWLHGPFNHFLYIQTNNPDEYDISR